MLGDKCSHGIALGEHCPECALISARQIVEHWGDAVDEARRVIARAEGKPVAVSQEVIRCGY